MSALTYAGLVYAIIKYMDYKHARRMEKTNKDFNDVLEEIKKL